MKKYHVWLAILTPCGSHKLIEVEAENKEQAEKIAIKQYLKTRRKNWEFFVLEVQAV